MNRRTLFCGLAAVIAGGAVASIATRAAAEPVAPRFVDAEMKPHPGYMPAHTHTLIVDELPQHTHTLADSINYAVPLYAG